jgi:arginyl-tRNA synthetase
MDALERCLASLSLDGPLPEVSAAKVETNPLDLCRVHLAAILADVLGCDIKSTFGSILWPNNIFNGDLAVVLPKLKLRPGEEASEVASKLINQVRQMMRSKSSI